MNKQQKPPTISEKFLRDFLSKALKEKDKALAAETMALIHEAPTTSEIYEKIKEIANLDTRIEILKESAKNLKKERDGAVDRIKHLRDKAKVGDDLVDLADLFGSFLEERESLNQQLAAVIFEDKKSAAYTKALKKMSVSDYDVAIGFLERYDGLDQFDGERKRLLKDKREQLIKMKQEQSIEKQAENVEEVATGTEG